MLLAILPRSNYCYFGASEIREQDFLGMLDTHVSGMQSSGVGAGLLVALTSCAADVILGAVIMLKAAHNMKII